jgi:CheY-like chemotaxis protein
MSQLLIVDDSPYVHDIVKTILEHKGFSPVSAFNGREAIETIDKNRDVKLIFLDVNMPIMDGMEFLEATKHIRKERNINVVVLTAQLDPTLIRQAKELGANGWIVKPPRAFDLTSFTTKLLNK